MLVRSAAVSLLLAVTSASALSLSAAQRAANLRLSAVATELIAEPATDAFWSGKKVLLVGASSGLGAALVMRGTTAHSFFRQAGCARHKPRKPPMAGRPFDFGASGNLVRAFGRHPLLWLLPTNRGVEGNGIFFELNVGDAEQVPWERYK